MAQNREADERRSSSAHIKLTPAELEVVAAAADRDGRTVSDYGRRVLVAVASGRAQLFEARAA